MEIFYFWMLSSFALFCVWLNLPTAQKANAGLFALPNILLSFGTYALITLADFSTWIDLYFVILSLIAISLMAGICFVVYSFSNAKSRQLVFAFLLLLSNLVGSYTILICAPTA